MPPYYYCFSTGLKQLIKTFKGDEHIHAGMRPYGLHSGNKLPLIVYPILIGLGLRKRGIEPHFLYTVTLNDWDTNEYSHPENYLLNLMPQGYSFQFMTDPFKCHNSCADHWAAVIEKELDIVREILSKTTVRIIRVSTLRDNQDFLKVLRFGLRHPQKVGSIAEKFMDTNVLKEPLQFAGAVCRSCLTINGETKYINDKDRVEFHCSVCLNKQEDNIQKLDYWMYVHLLGAAKNAAMRPDVWIAGGDFIDSGGLKMNAAIYTEVLGQPLEQSHLFTPVLLGPDGRKMSKSLGNTADTPLDCLIEKAQGWDLKEISIPS